MTDLSVWTDEPRKTRRRRKKDRRGGLAVLVAMLVVLLLIGGVAAVVLGAGAKIKDALSSSSAPDYPGPGTGEVQVEVKEGQTVAAVGRTLKGLDVVKSVDAFVQVANADPESSSLQPGFYQMARQMKASDALATLLDPSARIQAGVTLPEGLRLDETLKRLAKDTDIPLAQYEKALKRPAALGLPAYAKGNPEGFLFPATYEVRPDATAATVLEQLFDQYATVAEDVGVDRSARDPHDIVVIASLIEAEARHAEDYGKVARVVYNRLEQGMPLQFDSTINYAQKADKEIVTYEDLGEDSPYNTYKNQGLPPGPIGSPGKAALDAAINPPDGDWLYFVTVDPESGETKFTGDYQEFLRFKQELKSNQ